MKTKKGFTLVELLVVIAIIALLLSILLPALAKVRNQAKRIMCGANMHQWSIGLASYASDNRNYFPYNGYDALPGYLPFLASDITNPRRWVPGFDLSWNSRKVQEFWKKYVMKPGKEIATRKNNVLFCPTDTSHRQVSAGALDMALNQGLVGYFYLPYREPAGPAYDWNSLNMDYTPAGINWVSKKRFGDFSRAPILIDKVQSVSSVWFASGSVPYSSHAVKGGQPEGQNFLFEDGRVTWIKWKRLVPGDRPARAKVLGAVQRGSGGFDCFYKIPLGS